MKNRKKQAISMVLSLALICSPLQGTFTVRAAAVAGNYYSNAAELSENSEYPTEPGNIFAGWYQESSMNNPIFRDSDFVEGGAYAKFTDESVLTIKHQITADTTLTSSMTDLRLVTTVDSLNYRSAGFRVEIKGKTRMLMVDTVYETIHGYTKDGVNSYIPSEAFCKDSMYFVAYEITEIPTSAFDTPMKVTPIWTTLDGTVVTGKEQTILIYNAIEDGDVDAISYGQVWSTPSTVKVMQTEIDYTNRGKMQLSYQAVCNEYESCQLILTTGKDITSFYLCASDLKNGEHILSVDNIDVYVQKYVAYDDRAYDASQGTSYGIGIMPDALLPMDVADTYEENTIEAGANGGLWVTIYVPKGTVAGVYKGTFALIVDGENGKELLKIPVSMDVADYTLTDDVTAQTLFSWRYDRVAAGELDGSLAMMEEYYEFFHDYRISLQSMPLGTLSGEEFSRNVQKYYDELTSYTILSSIGDTFWGMSSVSVQNQVKEQILAVAAASTADRNLLDKAMIYFIDEPDLYDETVRADVISKITLLNRVLQSCVDSIASDTSGKYDSFKQIRGWQRSILNIPNVIPMTNVAWLLNNENTEEGQQLLNLFNCICPTYHSFNGRAEQLITLCKTYDIELWWYGCSIPPAPSPTYHIGDKNLLSARSVSWLQSIYGIEGNLYWDAAAYTDAASETYNEYINVYENPRRQTGSVWPAGDGFLAYPGAAYGVPGPLPSVRLMSIRDGMEEYEMIEELKENKSTVFGSSIMGDIVLSYWCRSLCDGGTEFMYADGQSNLDFAALRKQLLDYASRLPAHIDDTEDKTIESGIIRSIIKASEDDKNLPNCGDSTMDTAEGTEVLLTFDSYEEITGTSICMSKLMGATRVNKNTKHITEGNGSWRITPEGDYGDNTSYPWFRMRCTAETFGSSDFDKYEWILMDVYNDSDEEVSIQWNFTVCDMNGNYTVAEDVICKLQPNAWTTCKYDLTNDVYSNYFDLKNVKYMTVTFLDKKASEDDVTSTLYFDNLRGKVLEEERERTEFKFSLESGVDFERWIDIRVLDIQTLTTEKMQMPLLQVAYANTLFADAEEILGFGKYGIKGDATGSVWPEFTLGLGKVYAEGTMLSFWMYVETDEEIAQGKNVALECYTKRGGVAHTILKGTGKFNSWVQVNILLREVTDSIWFFINLDNGSSQSILGNEKVHVYFDNFRTTNNNWGQLH